MNHWLFVLSFICCITLESHRSIEPVYAAHQSATDTILINHQNITNLTLLAEVWGFLKYHHPAIAKGSFNFDDELLSVLPKVLKAPDNKALSAVLEQWVDHFGKPGRCANCQTTFLNRGVQKPDYGQLFNGHILSAALIGKLSFILKNKNTDTNYYVSMAPEAGNPIFSHENAYPEMTYPDAGYRLLTLFRYWNIIQYFYPYKHLIGRDWNTVLTDFIPRFARAANAREYALTTLMLINSIHDTHANILAGNKELKEFRGVNAFPFNAKFVEGKLVITQYYLDTLNIKRLVKVGDIIKSIGHVKTDVLVAKYLPLAGASNYITQLRDLPGLYLLRSNRQTMALEVSRNGKTIDLEIPMIDRQKINFSLATDPDPRSPGYRLITKDIGYLFAAKYKNSDLTAIKRTFAGTKGIIVDMRCYPSDFMPFTFVPFIKPKASAFAKLVTGSVASPGTFRISQTIVDGGLNEYGGKVVVMVNETTQSQAEYTTMALQSSPNVTVIGSTTAGADGNVSTIRLPANIQTNISGIGVLYPDGSETQRRGVKINYTVKPSISGIINGRDELLDFAKKLISGT